MALNAYLKIKSLRAGDITGSGKDGAIEVWGWSHEVVSPRDAASGLPTGRRQHKPITITKPIDKASPLLMQTLVSNDILSDWTLDVRRADATGAEEIYFTITLSNASVASVRHEQLNNQYPDNAPHAPREHVTFTYESIEWVWQDGGVTATDDWSTAG